MLVFVLALPAAQGDEPKKETTVKEKYDAMIKDFSTKQTEIVESYQKAKEEERPAILQKYRSLGKDWADKFYKLAEDNLTDPVAGDALSWIVQNAPGSEFVQKAMDRLLDKFPNHTSMERICATLGRSDSTDAE